ncbi:MAG: exosortase system-associated protein, TIGR04073 family [Mariprofundaceae bacterium]|nr:exosortase system-associated protein, TIGR04073 family [Mariprofundaceae bacterium]
MKTYGTRNILAVTAVALLTLGSPALAANYASDTGEKFSRGLVNTATGWGEVPKNIVLETKNSNIFIGLTYGTVKGVVHTVGRSVVGVLELGTFFIPSSEVVQSTYVWENTREETTYGL